MLKRLQEDARGYRETSTPVRPAELILDGSYADRAVAFIADAESEIRICAYAWRWYDSEPELGIQKLNLALWRAQRRGVIIRILVDTVAMATAFTTLGFTVRSVVPTRMLHTKALVIDKKTLVIGSHNLTKKATRDNYEVSVALQDFEPVAQFIDYFDRLWNSRG